MGEPVFLALLTADRVITEKNDKKGIIGTFNRLGTTKLPVSFPPWWIYASATNLVGEHSFAIEVFSGNDGKKLFSANGNINIGDANQVIEIAIPVVACAFPAAGSYSVLFSLDEMQIGARVLHVAKIDGPNNPDRETDERN
jgi:hypothetical protein